MSETTELLESAPPAASARGKGLSGMVLPDLKVMATCVRVPVISSHSISVHATFSRPVDLERARRSLVEAPMVVVLDDLENGEFPTPVDVVGAGFPAPLAGEARRDGVLEGKQLPTGG